MKFATVALCVSSCFAQTALDLARQSKGADFSSMTHTRPAQVGTTLPATCFLGEVYFKSDASPGKNWYMATSALPCTWTPVAATTTANPGGLAGQVQYNNAGSFSGFTVSGDGALDTATGALTYHKNERRLFCALRHHRHYKSLKSYFRDSLHSAFASAHGRCHQHRRDGYRERPKAERDEHSRKPAGGYSPEHDSPNHRLVARHSELPRLFGQPPELQHYDAYVHVRFDQRSGGRHHRRCAGHCACVGRQLVHEWIQHPDSHAGGDGQPAWSNVWHSGAAKRKAGLYYHRHCRSTFHWDSLVGRCPQLPGQLGQSPQLQQQHPRFQLWDNVQQHRRYRSRRRPRGRRYGGSKRLRRLPRGQPRTDRWIRDSVSSQILEHLEFDFRLLRRHGKEANQLRRDGPRSRSHAAKPNRPLGSHSSCDLHRSPGNHCWRPDLAGGTAQYYMSLWGGTGAQLGDTSKMVPVVPHTVTLVYHQQIDKWEIHSFPRVATNTEAVNGIDNTTTVTPNQVLQSINQNAPLAGATPNKYRWPASMAPRGRRQSLLQIPDRVVSADVGLSTAPRF